MRVLNDQMALSAPSASWPRWVISRPPRTSPTHFALSHEATAPITRPAWGWTARETGNLPPNEQSACGMGTRCMLRAPQILSAERVQKGCEFVVADWNDMFRGGIGAGVDIGFEFRECSHALVLEAVQFAAEITICLRVSGLVASRAAEHVFGE